MMIKKEIKLIDLAIACYIYSNDSKYDDAYVNFLKSTDFSPDLTEKRHRDALLTWLNAWGCRQFAEKDHASASLEILSWYNEYNSKLVNPDKKILDFTEENLNNLIPAFDSLSKKIASCRKTQNNSYPVKVGPTGAAKILFGIRGNALIPWDEAIRHHFSYDESGSAYTGFIKQVIAILKELKNECSIFGFSLDQLPEKIGRKNSTLPKLIDEYYWIIITNGWSLPNPETFRSWIKWSGIK